MIFKNFIAAFLVITYLLSYSLTELNLPVILSADVVQVMNPHCKKYQLKIANDDHAEIQQLSHHQFQDQICHSSFLIPELKVLLVNRKIEKQSIVHLDKVYKYSKLPQPPPPRL